MNNAVLRWGVLSTAQITLELIPGFARSQRNELVAVASRDAERAVGYADEHGIERAYSSYEELLADKDVDCVYIPLPNALHGQWTRAALDAGKHVLCEKPFTPTTAEARELFELAQARRLVLAEAFMYRHHPKTLKVRELLDAGEIGELRTIHSTFCWHVPDPSSDIRYSAELAGGALRDVGCYCVSYCTFAAGEAPDHVSALARRGGSGVEERLYATLGFPSGIVAQFDCALDLPLTTGVTLIGSEGAIHVPMPWYAHLEPLTLTLSRNGSTEELATPGDNAYLLEIEDLAAAVRGERRARIQPEETLRNVAVIESLLSSAGLS